MNFLMKLLSARQQPQQAQVNAPAPQAAPQQLRAGNFPQQANIRPTNQYAPGLESENAINPQGLGSGQYGRFDQPNAVAPFDMDGMMQEPNYQLPMGMGRMQGRPMQNMLQSPYATPPQRRIRF